MGIRAFIAVNFDQAVLNHLSLLITNLKLRCPDIKFLPAKNYHLTLRFLGQISEEQLARAADCLTKISGHAKPLNLELDGFIAFPSFVNPKILGLKIRNNKNLSDLYQKIFSEFNHLKIGKPEKRRFRPHLTIARLKNGGGDYFFLKREKFYCPARVKNIDLMRSLLRPSGAEYQLIHQFELCRK